MSKRDKFKLTRLEAARLCGCSGTHFDRAIRPYVEKAKITGEGASLRFDGPAVVHAYSDYKLAGVQKRLGDDAAMAAGGESPALERFRLARAKIAEMEAEEREKTHVCLAEMIPLIQRMAGAVRGASENLQRKFGPEIADVYNEAIQELFSAWNRSTYGARYPATDPGAPITTDNERKTNDPQ